MWKECAKLFLYNVYPLELKHMQVLISKGARLDIDMSHTTDRKGKGKQLWSCDQ
jgi:hypothetical protein